MYMQHQAGAGIFGCDGRLGLMGLQKALSPPETFNFETLNSKVPNPQTLKPQSPNL